MVRRIVLAVLTLSILVFGCLMAAGEEVDKLVIGVILPGTVTDYGWDYAPILALNKLETTLEIPVTHKYGEIVSPADAEGVIMDLIAAGVNWIWAWGFQYSEAVAAVAERVEGVYFTLNEGTPEFIVPGEVEVIEEFSHETAYLAGIVAASVSKTGVLGGILGSRTFELNLAEAGFRAGALSYDADIDYKSIVIGSWIDPEGGRRGAETLMAAGVDIIFCQGDGTSLGTIEAVRQARNDGEDVMYIGYPVDQSILAPGMVLTSLNYDYYDIVYEQAMDIINGEFGQGGYVMELGSGIELAPFYNFDSVISDDVKALLAATRQLILSGELEVPME